MNTKRLLLSLSALIAIGLTFKIMPMQSEAAPFTLDKEGLENVCKDLFKKTRQLIKEASAGTRYTMRPNLSETEAQANKSTINRVITQALSEVNVSKALKNAAPEQVAALTAQLKRITEAVIFERYTKPADLKWCSCDNAPEYMRVALVVHIANDARKERDLNKRIVYTSIASGSMLLDYLIVSELIHYGFKNIQVNAIELGLLDIPEIQAIINQANTAEKKQLDLVAQHTASYPGDFPTGWLKASEQQYHAENLLNDALNSRSYFLAFERKVKEKADPKGIKVESNHYDHMGDYIARAKKYDFEKTDILILVDPSSDIYPLKNSIGAQAFALQFSTNSDASYFDMMDHSLILFMPSTGLNDMKLYSNINFEYLDSQDLMRNVYEEISELIYEAQDVAAVRRNANLPFHYNSFIINKAHEKFGDQGTNAENQAAKNPYEDEYADLKVYWLSDAYLALQDVVRDGLSNVNTAAVYEIAYPIKGRPNPILRRINASQYQNEDVITPNIGAALQESGYKLIQPSPAARTIKKIPSPEAIADIREKRSEIKKTKTALSELPMAEESAPESYKKKNLQKNKKAKARSLNQGQTESSNSDIERVSPTPSATSSESALSEEAKGAFLQQIKERNKE